MPLLACLVDVLKRERMPYVTDGPDGLFWTCKNGMSFGLVGGVGPGGAKLVPGQNYRVDKMAETGLYEAGKRGERRPGDPHLRIKEMEKDGDLSSDDARRTMDEVQKQTDKHTGSIEDLSKNKEKELMEV